MRGGEGGGLRSDGIQTPRLMNHVTKVEDFGRSFDHSKVENDTLESNWPCEDPRLDWLIKYVLKKRAAGQKGSHPQGIAAEGERV